MAGSLKIRRVPAELPWVNSSNAQPRRGLRSDARQLLRGGVRRSHRSLSVLMADVQGLVLVVADGRIELAAGGDTLGCSPESLVGIELIDAIVTTDPQALERLRLGAVDSPAARSTATSIELMPMNGLARWIDVTVNDRRADPDVGGLVVTVHDATERQQLLNRLAEQTATDPVTGLATRHRFTETLVSAVHRAKRTGEHLAVLYAGIDGFRSVNEAFGHSGGDHVLHEVAARLNAAVRSEDLVGRIVGDEFAVLLAGLQIEAGRGYAVDVADRIADSMTRPILLANEPGTATSVTLTVSIGVAHCGRGTYEPTAEELLAEARTSAEAVKQNSRRWRDLSV